MPKSKRARVYHLTQVNKKGREAKERLFSNIRETIPKYQHCFVFSVDNMRNNYLKDVRHELNDCRFVFSTILSLKSFFKSFLLTYFSFPASSSARQNSWPARWAQPLRKNRPTVCTA